MQTRTLDKNTVIEYAQYVRKTLTDKNSQLACVHYDNSPLYLMYEGRYNGGLLIELNDCKCVVVEGIILTWPIHKDRNLDIEIKTALELTSSYKWINITNEWQYKLVKPLMVKDKHKTVYNNINYYLYDSTTQLNTEGKSNKNKRKSINSVENQGRVLYFKPGELPEEIYLQAKNIIDIWVSNSKEKVWGWTKYLLELFNELTIADSIYFKSVFTGIFTKDGKLASFSITEEITPYYICLLDGKSDRQYDDTFYSINKAMQYYEIAYWAKDKPHETYNDLGSGDTVKRTQEEIPSLDKFKLDLKPYKVNKQYSLFQRKSNVSSVKRKNSLF